MKPLPLKTDIYSCGPTVYGYTHIGNARAAISADFIAKQHCADGGTVRLAMNFTDIDDKIIEVANKTSKTHTEVSQFYIDAYLADMKALDVNVDFRPKVSENIPQIIDIIQTLIDKGFAKQVNGDIVFITDNYVGYGALSGWRKGVNKTGDFALWKSVKPNEPSWESPWGNGRPGWHIECSAMLKSVFGKADLHMGGSDLLFPHHENEIA